VSFPNSSETPSSGGTIATHTQNGKEAQASVLTDADGHILGTAPVYRLSVPALAAGASKVYFDLFNATGSGKTVKVLAVIPNVSGAVAVTGALAVDLFLTRTTAIGTGGTAMTLEGTSLTAIAISKMDPADAALSASITARSAPTGGATAGAVLSGVSLFTEETNAGTYLSPLIDFVMRMLGIAGHPLVVPENTGIRVVQGAVASVGNIGFDVIFAVV
jgi:hypothetical protein